jgi:hypothetical protein
MTDLTPILELLNLPAPNELLVIIPATIAVIGLGHLINTKVPVLRDLLLIATGEND